MQSGYFSSFLSEKIWPLASRSRLNSPKVPTAQGKGKMAKGVPVGENREFLNFAKTQGLLVAQVVNSLILKLKNIAIFAAKISKSWIGLTSQFCVCDSHRLCI